MEWMLLPLKRYADFSGRSRRMEFWMFLVFQILLWIGFSILGVVAFGGAALMVGTANANAAASGIAAMGMGMIVLYAIEFFVAVGLFIPNLAVAVRRLHDTDRTGWWILSPLAGYVLIGFAAASDVRALSLLGVLVTFATGIALLVFYFLEGTVGPNRFGSDPKGRVDPHVFA